MSGLNNKKYLDETGLSKLWARITDYGAPRWTAYKPVQGNITDESVILAYQSAATDEQKAAGKGNVIAVEIPGATQSLAGVMTANDKNRVDNIEVIAEDLITIKNIKVGQSNENGENNRDARKLAIDDGKNVNWDFVYNATTDTLDIIDVITNKVMTSVHINDFIGDALIDGILTDVDLVDHDENNNSGAFIKLIFTITRNNGDIDSKDIYINVADLIDVYTAGPGISIEQGSIDTNEDIRNSVICLKTAGTDATLDDHNHPKGIGGFVAHKVSNATAVGISSIEKRYFGVEIGNDAKGIVNVPIGTITNTDNSITGEISISPIIGGDADIITGVNIVELDDHTGHIIQPTGTTLHIDKETDITTSGNAGEDAETLQFGDSFTVFKDIAPGGTNGHELIKSNTTWTLPELSKGDPIVSQESQTIYADNAASAFNLDIVTDIYVDSKTGTIAPITTQFTGYVDVLSIDNATIESLTYPAS